MGRGLLNGLLILTLAAPGQGGEARPKKPRLDLRATPRLGLAPARVLATAELVGGETADEDFYCPLLEWDWDDGTRSVREADCLPFEPGAALERHFTADHVYRRSGNYSLRVTLRRASRSLAAASISVGLR